MNQAVTSDVLRQQVKDFVRLAFSSCGASFEDPTRASILMAINQCRTNAESMMGPPGAQIIRHRYDEMMKLVNKLPQ